MHIDAFLALEQKELAARLRAARKRARLSMQKLSSNAGLSFVTIDNIEHLRCVPRRETVIALVAALARAGVDVLAGDLVTENSVAA